MIERRKVIDRLYEHTKKLVKLLALFLGSDDDFIAQSYVDEKMALDFILDVENEERFKRMMSSINREVKK